jgi:hypothetical protein
VGNSESDIAIEEWDPRLHYLYETYCPWITATRGDHIWYSRRCFAEWPELLGSPSIPNTFKDKLPPS